MNILENTRRWRQTYKGLTANLYAKIRERSKRNNRQNDEYSLGEFRIWLKSTNFHDLFRKWEANAFVGDKRPSVDRINPLDGYRFENMQVITAQENRAKGDKEKLVLWGKRIYQSTLTKVDIAIFPSIKEASAKTGINRNNISSVLHRKRTKAGGYYWHF